MTLFVLGRMRVKKKERSHLVKSIPLGGIDLEVSHRNMKQGKELSSQVLDSISE